MESLKPCCYIWMSEESWTHYVWQDWGLHIRHRNPLVKISVSLMVHQETLLVLDSDHSINFYWPHQALKESINNRVWPSWATKLDTTSRVKEFPQLKLKGNISQPLLGVAHEHLPSQATTWHMAWSPTIIYVHVKVKIKFRLIIFFVFNLGWFSISFVS